jgi:recombination associated protein RdgC
MWFKNLAVYRLPEGWSLSSAELEQRLQARVLQACGPYEKRRLGWAHVGPSQRFVHTVMGQHLITLAAEEKILPAVVIKQQVQARAAIMAEEQGYPVGRRQMRELKETVTSELMARALTKVTATHAWIDPVNGWFVVDASSLARAEEVVTAMREALDTFAVTPIETETSPARAMVGWLTIGDAPLRFAIDQDLELQAVDKTKATVKYARHALDGKEIREHLSAGKYATRLGLTWNDRIAFTLNEKLQVKRVQFLDVAKDDSGEGGRDAAEQFDIDFALMAGELGQLLGDLENALGGRLQAKAETAASKAGAKDSKATARTSEGDDVEALFEAAKVMLEEQGFATISMLQRQLSIGYNRAARILEQMEADGFVGPLQPDGTRQLVAPQAAA